MNLLQSLTFASLSLISLSLSAQVSITATRISQQPLLSPSAETFYNAGVFNPAATKLPNGDVLLLTRGQNDKGLSQIGSAISSDATGTHFTAAPTPTLAPKQPYELGGGVEDPRLVKINGTFYLTYTGYNGKDAQLCLATSRDARHWQRRGVILPAYRGTWNKQWTKSGAIIPQKINGKWWMYYLGTRDLPGPDPADDRNGHTVDYMGLAVSPDLIHWKDATPEPVLDRRRDAFDSRVMEPGPPPIITPAGILLLYNGADAHLIYRTGWALFDLHDPSNLIARSDRPFFEPELPWEKIGQVPNVVFLEGMTRAPNADLSMPPYAPKQTTYRMLGYYGAADKYIGGVSLDIAVSKK
jgi:predicted GH43/DUF377 family glycosyl hydrolase